MIRGSGLFVVTVAALRSGTGCSTLAANLAVYLKALREDLPIRFFSCDPATDAPCMFSLGEGAVPSIDEWLSGDSEGPDFCCGQFGVEYLARCRAHSSAVSPSSLRIRLAETNLTGLLLIDAGADPSDMRHAALWAADLVLVPCVQRKDFLRMRELRRSVQEGGGNDQRIWLLPSTFSASESATAAGCQLLRLIADECGQSVTDSVLPDDVNIYRKADGEGRSILTRLHNTATGDIFRSLAEFVLSRVAVGPEESCRKQRMIDDGLLPQRARRVVMACPLCGGFVAGPDAYYLESRPWRRRVLLHPDCLAVLLKGSGIAEFWSRDASLLIETGVEGEGRRVALRLSVPGTDGLFGEQRTVCPDETSLWPPLLRTVTGLELNEQRPGFLLVSACGTVAELLSPAARRRFAVTWRDDIRELHRL
ncbi:MAG: hypothetical protein C0618_06520 [Desulfuromonas sp.]|nr:MAG: hypothetical protein C0618_06520 [Desulfuromonas sp.]